MTTNLQNLDLDLSAREVEVLSDYDIGKLAFLGFLNECKGRDSTDRRWLLRFIV